MKISVLASGSKGNSTYIENEGTKILIDLGTSCKYVEDRLRELQVEPNEIDAILVTHDHADHIAGIRVFNKKFGTDVYIMPTMKKSLTFLTNEKNYAINNSLKNINFTIFPTSHDTDESIGIVVKSQKSEIVYITDTGYIHNKYYKMISNKDLYVMESNHDVPMLMNSGYPFYLKQRILGDKGHLSNDDSAYHLKNIIGEKTKTIILAHLSEENNSRDLANQALVKQLDKIDHSVENIVIAKQKEKTELFEL